MKILVFVVATLCVSLVLGSSHSEAPGTAKAPNADLTDFYMFRSYETGRENYVTILANIYPLQDPFGGPNYFSLSTNHYYNINIDNDGDAVADMNFKLMYETELGGDLGNHAVVDDDICGNGTITTENIHGGLEVDVGGTMVPVPLKFIGPINSRANEDGALNWYEYYTVELNGTPITLVGGSTSRVRKPMDYAGTKTFPEYANYASEFIYDVDFPGCGTAGKMFLGQRKESFPVALGKIFDLINMTPLEGSINECTENDDLRNKNIVTWAMEIPITCLVDQDDVIGGWSAITELIHDGNSHVEGRQVSRLGQPLVNEVVIGLRDKGIFNQADPTQDGALAVYVTNPTLPYLIDALFRDALGATSNIAPANIPRLDLVAVFLTGLEGLNQPQNVTASEQLRLNTATATVAAADQDDLGVIAGDTAGFPNGRRPGDDVVDIALRVVMGVLCVGTNDFGCTAADVPVGDALFTDGAPNHATFFDESFPYILAPLPGATADVVTCDDNDGTDGTDSDSSSAASFGSWLF